MGYEQKDNSGSLFVNERKTQPNHPDRSGSVLINGIEYWASGWIKEGKNGKAPWLSMSFTPKESNGGSKATPSRQENFDDDIPF